MTRTHGQGSTKQQVARCFLAFHSVSLPHLDAAAAAPNTRTSGAHLSLLVTWIHLRHFDYLSSAPHEAACARPPAQETHGPVRCAASPVHGHDRRILRHRTKCARFLSRCALFLGLSSSSPPLLLLDAASTMRVGSSLTHPQAYASTTPRRSFIMSLCAARPASARTHASSPSLLSAPSAIRVTELRSAHAPLSGSTFPSLPIRPRSPPSSARARSSCRAARSAPGLCWATASWLEATRASRCG